MAVDIVYFLKVAPEFASADPALINFYINEARLYINFAAWGAKADYAHALFTAHLMKMSTPAAVANGGAGPVNSSKVGDLQRTYSAGGSSSGGGQSLEKTSYGILFLQLRKTIAATPLVII